jgi:hypothetical protein
MTILSPIPMCTRYYAGHQMHWIQWKQAMSRTPQPAAFVRLDELGIMLALGRKPLRLWNHDMPRMTQALEDPGAAIDVWQELGALRIGNHWFNCSAKTFQATCALRRT